MGIQVTGLTKDKNTWEKEYIDFSFNGRYISEFGLVAVSDSDRLSFAAQPDFQDDVSEVKGYTGQHFWGTNIKTIKRTFYLSTDGMSEADLNAFKAHFQPGRYGKFIETHLSYRYSYCRVAEVTKFTLIPFRVKKKMYGREIYVNEYKGEAQLVLIWDLPYSYSIENYANEITDENYELMIRAAISNGLPFTTSWREGKIAIRDAAYLDIGRLDSMKLDDTETLLINQCHLGSNKMLYIDNTLMNSILVRDTGHRGTLPMVCYNPSTVASNTQITMNFAPQFTPIGTKEWMPVYYNNIADDINSTVYAHYKKYNTIRSSNSCYITPQQEESNNNIPEDEVQMIRLIQVGEDDYIYEFNYTSPGVIYAINRAIQLAYQCYNKETATLVEFTELLREEINHDEVMTWAISVLSILEKHDAKYITEGGQLDKSAKASQTIWLTDILGGEPTGVQNASWFVYFNLLMLLFLGHNISETGEYALENGNWKLSGEPNTEFFITFDGDNSVTTIQYSYNQLTAENKIVKILNKEEKCGDMNLSSYLKLDGGDTLNDNGKIAYCHVVDFLKGGRPYDVKGASVQYKFIYV